MLSSLVNVKAFKNITEEQHDEELSRLIPVVQAFIESYCERTFTQEAGLVEYHSTEPGQTTLLLRRPPIALVTTIHDDPLMVYGASTLVAATDYAVTHPDSGIVTFLRPRTGGGINNIKVVYTGGFAENSDTLMLIEQAAIELIWLARDKGDQALMGLSAKSVADSSFTLRNDWPAGVQTILDLHHLRHG